MSQKVKTWESHVPGCFGGSDHIFAGHPAEEKRAKELRKVCSEQRIPMDDVAKAIEHFLKSKKVGDALIQEQVERARAALKRGGVPQSFASLLAGGDDGDTDRRTEEFRAAYQASLAEDVKSRLPASAPVVTAPLPQRPRRGIRRLR